MENLSLDSWISISGVVATLLAAILGILIGHGLAQRSKKKKLAVWEEASRILINSADHEGLEISAVVNGQAVAHLNRQTFTVLNSGPNAIADIAPIITVNPPTAVLHVQVSASHGSVRITDSTDGEGRILSCDFLNPRENMTIDVVYAGEHSKAEIQLRMPDVHVHRVLVKDSSNRAEIMLAALESLPMGALVKALYAPLFRAMF